MYSYLLIGAFSIQFTHQKVLCIHDYILGFLEGNLPLEINRVAL